MSLRKIALEVFTHRSLALLRWDAHFLSVRVRNALFGQRRRIRQALTRQPGPEFLNLGSGPRGIASADWINIDGFKDRNVDFVLDFSRGLPFPDNSFAGVFCEHVIEHFTYDDASRLCAQLLRVLKPGGTVRLIVPDAERIVRTYIEEPELLIAHRGIAGMTAMQVVNDYFRQRYEHQFLFDWETMQHMLVEAGFQEVTRCSLRVGRRPELLIDDEKYGWESLYVEAVKPA